MNKYLIWLIVSVSVVVTASFLSATPKLPPTVASVDEAYQAEQAREVWAKVLYRQVKH